MTASSGTRARRHATSTARGCSPVNGLRRTKEEVYAEAQERQARLTRSFFEGSRELLEKAQRGQPISENLAWEGSANPYAEFLECLFFYHREDARAAERSTGGAGVLTPFGWRPSSSIKARVRSRRAVRNNG